MTGMPSSSPISDTSVAKIPSAMMQVTEGLIPEPSSPETSIAFKSGLVVFFMDWIISIKPLSEAREWSSGRPSPMVRKRKPG